VPGPESAANDSFSAHFDRRWVTPQAESGRDGLGRTVAWMRVLDDVEADPVVHQAWLAYISDDLPSDAVKAARRAADPGFDAEHAAGISLDHTIWFHRPMQADRWHLHDFSCHHLVDGRGLAIGHVFDASGQHVATVAQEVLLRSQAPRT